MITTTCSILWMPVASDGPVSAATCGAVAVWTSGALPDLHALPKTPAKITTVSTKTALADPFEGLVIGLLKSFPPASPLRPATTRLWPHSAVR